LNCMGIIPVFYLPLMKFTRSTSISTSHSNSCVIHM
jgi:hypothetical protein